MTVADVTEHRSREETQPKACLVTDYEWFESIRGLLLDANLLISFRERLRDLPKERDCSLYVVDTAVKDFDTWPAPLLTIPDASSRDWLFLVSRASDAFRLQPLPRNTRFLDRKRSSVEKIASLIRRQLDPESRKRFARIKFLEDVGGFLLWMENGKTYILRLSELPEADSTKVMKWSLSKNREYIRVVQESGNQFQIPWDDVLYHCEPEYEFYKGKQLLNTNASVNKIGQRVREARQEKGYSVQALADKTRMKRPNLSRLEHGRHQPSLETLERIAEALDIPVIYLVAGKR